MTESFAQMFEESLASQRIRPGQILTGRVIDVGPDVVVVSAGLKSEAVIPVQQFKNERGEIEVKVGDDVEVALDSVEDGSGDRVDAGRQCDDRRDGPLDALPAEVLDDRLERAGRVR